MLLCSGTLAGGGYTLFSSPRPEIKEMKYFVFALPIVSVLGLSAARMAELGARRDIIHGVIREHLTLRLFLSTGLVILLAAIVEYIVRDQPISWPLFAAGWISGLVSFYIRRRAIASLGRFWSLHVEIRENHVFVRSGPFRFLRHPVYFSMILELLAFVLICQAWSTGLFAPVLFIPALILRVRIEEAALLDKFGNDYRRYQQSTPAIIPGLW